MEFSLNNLYNAFDVENDYTYESLDLAAKLELLTVTLAHSPDSIVSNDETLEELIEIVHALKTIDDSYKKQIMYLVSSSLRSGANQCTVLIALGDFADSVDVLKSMLERYGYLMYVALSIASKEEFTAGTTKSKQTSVKWKNNCHQMDEALEAVSECLSLELARIFVTTPERMQFMEMLIRPVFNLMEIPERMKIASLKALMFRSIAMAVSKNGFGSTVQNLIVQSLTYYAHLPPYMAELVHVLATEYDNATASEELLRELSHMEFSSNDTTGSRAISEFLTKLSELSPRLILKQMSYTAQLLDNSNQTLRCAVVETCGNIVVDILKAGSNADDEHAANATLQVDGLLDLLEERFLDQNPFVRTKAIQSFVKICNLPVRIALRRQSVALAALRSLNDKSTLVRRNAIKLLCKLILTHPFSGVHGTQLGYNDWKKRFDEAEAEVTRYLPTRRYKTNEDGDGEDVEMETEDVPIDDESLPDRNVLIKAKLTHQYYSDALHFIEALQESTTAVSTLLFSKNRNEVLESMDFLVLADTYDIANAHDGVRRMLHLVWMKGLSDEGKSIASHLIDCYKSLFLTAPQNATLQRAAVLFAKNLIKLTFEASVADLASLEKLVCMLYESRYIHQEVVKVLWHIYSKAGSGEEEYPPELVLGSILVLGMLSTADNSIVQAGFESLLSIGLGEIGKSDLDLRKHSCTTLMKIIPASAVKSGDGDLLDVTDDAVSALKGALMHSTDNPKWFEMAEQAIYAVFRITNQPEEVCAEVIKFKALEVFDVQSSEQATAMSQLLFIVGHVAIKTIEHLERLETQFKLRKHALESKKEKNDTGDNELEMIGGTSEDDFTDAITFIRERELLYGEKSLLAKFGPLVTEICTNSHLYKSTVLQRSATLCLAKLMCVSSKFCEDNLPLLIKFMETSPDPVIRSNCVLGLGDMAVCFNNLVDENTDFLYRRLNDENLMVQRTCLMTVTFLILAGQVKVKGQLSSMAKCLENPDQGISDMCKLFFTELATKDNAIYNGFIDIFSGLTTDETLAKDALKRIVKFLILFIEKEKHQKLLAEKLLVRLTKTQNEMQWNDVAFVLTTIPYKNEAISQALEGGYKMVLARD